MKLDFVWTKFGYSFALVGLLTHSGCEAHLKEGQGAHANDGTDDADKATIEPQAGVVTSAVQCRPSVASASSVPLRRLTRVEYENAVRDLFGVKVEASSTFIPDDGLSGFASNNVSAVSARHLEQYHTAAKEIAAEVMPALEWTSECEEPLDASCARMILPNLGLRIFRRPLSEEEIDAATASVEATMERGSFWDAMSLILRAYLSSPSFLYRAELPPANAKVEPLDEYELATRLSFLLWSSTPDEQLLAQAEAGTLSDPAQLEAEARRLLVDEKAAESIATFHRQWLGIQHLEAVSKDKVLYPDYDEELRSSMVRETDVFTASIFRGGAFTDLFSATHSYIDGKLSELYGTTAPDVAYDRVELPPEERSGLLTQASVLSAHSLAAEGSPILRGKFIRQQMFCQSIPEPPPGVDVTPPEIDPALTTKERFRQHREAPSCASCHELMDPLGFGFQHYDAIGAWTETDGNHPVDATGELMHTDVDGVFDGARELGESIALSAEAQQCYLRQWLRYSSGRVESEEELCSIATAYERAAAEGLDLEETVLALVLSEAFRMKAAQQEARQ